MHIMCSALCTLKHLNTETQLRREKAKRAGEADCSAELFGGSAIAWTADCSLLMMAMDRTLLLQVIQELVCK